ncbi:MAG: TonB-dependent receptor [candidate division KSB1 bacterium]|nr:TonB-dependent receptor [candidate division KSB1 bacterium]
MRFCLFKIITLGVCVIMFGCFNAGTLKAEFSEAVQGAKIPKTLSRKVSINFENISLETALASITKQGQIPLSYNRDMIPLDQKINIDLQNVSVHTVLLAALQNTSTSLRVTPNGTLAVTPQSTQSASGKSKRKLATVTGKVIEGSTGEPLPGANVYLEGTSFGAATDREGEYIISNVPVGTYTIKFKYIGYKELEKTVQVAAGKNILQDAEMVFEIVKGEVVTITAQAEGQLAAINQQLSAEKIVNVVSSDRIRELPDQNAAESVGRLPGVAIQRSSGEGQKIMVRGLSPKYSVVTINNQRVPSTDRTNRSLDLSMISSEMLEGIELSKALTPDQEGDAIGGVVNFTVKQADPGFQSRVNLQGGYNRLRDNYGNYKANVTLSNRFFNNMLGILATGSYQNVQRPNDEFSAQYSASGIDLEKDEYIMQTSSLSLEHSQQTRERYAMSLYADFEMSANQLLQYSGFYSVLNKDGTNRRKDYEVGDGSLSWGINEWENNILLWNQTLSGEHSLFNDIKLDWALSQSSTKNKSPNNYSLNFRQEGGFYGELLDVKKGIDFVQQAAKNDLSKSHWSTKSAFSTTDIMEAHQSAQTSLKVPFALGNMLSGYHKVGFKYRRMYRENSRYTMGIRTEDRSRLSNQIHSDNPDKYNLYNSYLTAEGFVDPDFKDDDFLDGRFDFPRGLRTGVAEWLYEDHTSYFSVLNSSLGDDYDAMEAVTAAYYMTNIHLWRRLMIIGGLRYEHTHNDYTGTFSKGGGEWSRVFTDTSTTFDYEDWLPMIQARYKLTSFLDMRMAATRTLVRPDYMLQVPRIHIDVEQSQATQIRTWNILKPGIMTFPFTYYSGRFGLFSVGGFFKRLENISYRARRVQMDPDKEYYGYSIYEPQNTDGITDVYGFEVDMQTNLLFLPSPLDGFVINANYTRIYGHSYFPVNKSITGPPPYYSVIYVTEERKGRIPGQSDYIANLSLGYEKGRFSGRVTMNYQSDMTYECGCTGPGGSLPAWFCPMGRHSFFPVD